MDLCLVGGPGVAQDHQQGNINNQHIYLARYLDFFPAGAIGTHSKTAGQGTPLTLHFDGLPDTAKTDIDPVHKIFRLRGRHCREFLSGMGSVDPAPPAYGRAAGVQQPSRAWGLVH